MKERDLSILEYMMGYLNEIAEAKEHFGDDTDIFKSNVLYFNSVMMSLFQIGELTTHLSDEFKSKTAHIINWGGLRGFRNLIGHNYKGVAAETAWDNMNKHLPAFMLFCEEQIKSLEFLGDEEIDI